MASLEELQHALAIRLTSGANANGAKQAVELAGKLLSQFDAEELAQSRETLVRKRLGQIAALLPRTRHALQSEYEPLCREFIDRHHFDGTRAVQLDAIHFARWLNDQRTLDQWQLNMANFEALRLQWLISTRFFAIRRFKNFVGPHADRHATGTFGSVWIAIRLGRWGIFRPFL